MILKILLEEQSIPLSIEDDFLKQADSFFNKMDEDMNKGWQMGRDWIEKPDFQQRLTIVADKLLTALENNEKSSGIMMAGYIISRAPSVSVIEMDITGEMGHEFIEDESQLEPAISEAHHGSDNRPAPAAAPAAGKMDKISAMQQAAKEVSRVFKAGKQYKFSMYNPQVDQWEESPAIADKEEADKLREFAFKKRFDQLTGD